jgi:mannose-6-phosphate isomerase-like protein (cupin superfamily)
MSKQYSEVESECDKEEEMKVRRVVTGQDASGKSVFVADEQVDPITLTLMPGSEFHRLWGADETLTLPSDGTPTPQPRFFPPADGFRWLIFTVPPEAQTSLEDIDFAAALNEATEKLPGVTDVMEPDHPGMHTTDTVDFEVVLSGEIVLELDDGAEVVLKPGDTVVQNGTRHAWRNRGDVPAIIAAGLIGAHRA